jgi:hypothetical protein
MPACAGGARWLSGPAGAPRAPCAIGNARFAPPTIDDIVAETRETYDGPLAVGEDLMTFEIGERVAVRRRVA